MHQRVVLMIILNVLLITLHAQQRYIFYLHGRIVELQGPNAIETTNGYGAYKYNDIIDSLKGRGFEVLSEVRGPNTDAGQYAEKIKNEILGLIQKGVRPSSITVIGASKGSYITMLVSHLLKDPDVNFVLMASCSESEGVEVYGNILSIHEKSDSYTGCDHLRKISKSIKHYKDIEINTGLRHGFLYRPIPEWLHPAVKWASGLYD